MNGYCGDCGKYGPTMANLTDGTNIYRCYDCDRVCGEHLAVFDVTYNLAERQVQEDPPVEDNLLSVAIPQGVS